VREGDRPQPGVWQELRNRRVTRTVVTYFAVGYALMEATWFLVPFYGTNDSVARVVVGAIVLGFPFAVVLAWTYDLTPGGIVRTPEDGGPINPEPSPTRLRRSAWLLLCATAVGVGLLLRSLRP
jgi:hypothetical protein